MRREKTSWRAAYSTGVVVLICSVALVGTGCPQTVPPGGDGGSGAECGGGGPGAPTLVGLVADKDMILAAEVQVAYNDDTAFFHIAWDGDRGDTHDYVRLTNGAWQKEGGPRRDERHNIDVGPKPRLQVLRVGFGQQGDVELLTRGTQERSRDDQVAQAPKFDDEQFGVHRERRAMRKADQPSQ